MTRTAKSLTTKAATTTRASRSELTIPGYFAAKLDEMAALSPGWDGYGALVPSLKARTRAVVLLEEIASALACIDGSWAGLSLVPTLDGGAQLEWRREGADRELEIWIDTAGTASFLRSIDEDASELAPDDVRRVVFWFLGRE